MRSLRLVELQRARKRFQNAFGNPAEVPALESGVVGDADAGEDRDLLPAQARNTPGTEGRQTNLVGRELRLEVRNSRISLLASTGSA